MNLLNVQENPRLVPLIKAEENIKVQNLAEIKHKESNKELILVIWNLINTKKMVIERK